MEIPILGAWWPLALLVLAWLVYLGITWNHDYWKKRGVPYIKPLPIFGNIKDSLLMKKTIAEVFHDLYWKFDGYRFAGIFNPMKTSLLIRDPELIKDILVREFTSFHDNEFEVDVKADPMFGRNPFVLRGERWKVTRARLMPAFTSSKLKTLFPLIPDICRDLKELLKNNDCSGEFEAKELCARFTTDVVTICAYGISGNSLKNADSEFRKVGRGLFDSGIINTIKLFIAFLVPSISSMFRFRLISKKVEEFFVRMVGEVMTYREKNNITRNDYLQHLISVKNKASDGVSTPQDHPFTDIDVAAQATTFFLDGFETSSIGFSFALYALATNPDVQTKLRNEINSVLKVDGGELTYEGIQKMTYLDMFLSESLRLYTPIYFLSRVCTRPIQLETPTGGKITVEKGTSLRIPVYSLHRDPKYFPDPETFNPENFSEENKKNRHKYVYLPFGEGPRTCLGSKFAVMQLKAGLAAIVSSFEISPTSRTPIPIVPDPSNFLLAVKGGLWLKFSDLSDESSGLNEE